MSVSVHTRLGFSKYQIYQTITTENRLISAAKSSQNLRLSKAVAFFRGGHFYFKHTISVRGMQGV